MQYRKTVLKQNLATALPTLDETNTKQITAEVYHNLASFVVELLQSQRLNQEFFANNFTMHNWEVMEGALKENKGVLLVTGHLGNFEWAGSYACSQSNTDIYAIMKPLHNPYINKFIITTREKLGFKLLYTRNAYKKGLQILRQKNILAIIADQDARHLGVFVDFFGIPASTAKGAALFHLKTGAPIVVGVSIRRGWGKYDIYYERVPSCTDLKLTQENIFQLTRAHTQILEKWIKKYPGQYLWTHKRWKTKPNTQ